MSADVVRLLKSQDTGHYATTVKYSTPQKMHSVFSNMYHAAAEGYWISFIVVKETQKYFVSECSMYDAMKKLTEIATNALSPLRHFAVKRSL